MDYIEWYNKYRIKGKLKGPSPIQYRIQSLSDAYFMCLTFWADHIPYFLISCLF